MRFPVVQVARSVTDCGLNFLEAVLRSAHSCDLLGHVFRYASNGGGYVAFDSGCSDLFRFFDKSLSRQKAVVQGPLSVRCKHSPHRTERDAAIGIHTAMDQRCKRQIGQ